MLYTFDRWKRSDDGDPGPLEYKVRRSVFDSNDRTKHSTVVNQSNVSESSMLLCHVHDVSAIRPIPVEEKSFFYKTGQDARPEQWPDPGTYDPRENFWKSCGTESRVRPKTGRSVFGDSKRFEDPAKSSGCNFLVGPGTYSKGDRKTPSPFVKTTFTNEKRLHPADTDLRKHFPGPGAYKEAKSEGFQRFLKSIKRPGGGRVRTASKKNDRHDKFWVALETSKFGRTRGTYTPGPAAHGKTRSSTATQRPRTRGTFGTHKRLGMLECLRRDGYLPESPGPATAPIGSILKLSTTDRIRLNAARAITARSLMKHTTTTKTTTRSKPARSPTRSSRADGRLRRPSLSDVRSWNIGDTEALAYDRTRREKERRPPRK